MNDMNICLNNNSIRTFYYNVAISRKMSVYFKAIEPSLMQTSIIIYEVVINNIVSIWTEQKIQSITTTYYTQSTFGGRGQKEAISPYRQILRQMLRLCEISSLKCFPSTRGNRQSKIYVFSGSKSTKVCQTMPVLGYRPILLRRVVEKRIVDFFYRNSGKITLYNTVKNISNLSLFFFFES